MDVRIAISVAVAAGVLAASIWLGSLAGTAFDDRTRARNLVTLQARSEAELGPEKRQLLGLVENASEAPGESAASAVPARAGTAGGTADVAATDEEWDSLPRTKTPLGAMIAGGESLDVNLLFRHVHLNVSDAHITPKQRDAIRRRVEARTAELAEIRRVAGQVAFKEMGIAVDVGVARPVLSREQMKEFVEPVTAELRSELELDEAEAHLPESARSRTVAQIPLRELTQRAGFRVQAICIENGALFSTPIEDLPLTHQATLFSRFKKQELAGEIVQCFYELGTCNSSHCRQILDDAFATLDR